MRCENAVRGVGAEHIKVTVLEAAFALVKHIKRLRLVLFHRIHCSLKHSLGGGELSCRDRVKDVFSLVEGLRLYTGDATKGLFQSQNREQHQCDGHRKACGHHGLSNGIFCAEEEAEAYCDGTSAEQHNPHHRRYPCGLTAQESQSTLIAKLVQSCEGLAVPNPFVLTLRTEPIIGLPKPVICIPGVGA